jgi:pyruvate dehydrogenase E1 component alpha subunit
VHDDAFYVPKEMFEEWAKRDPVQRFHGWLRENVGLGDDEDGEITSAVKRLVSEAIERAEQSPPPDPSTLLEGVFATPEELDTPHHK